MRWLVVLGLWLLHAPVGAAEQWEWSESVGYADTHDPSRIELSDGREITVQYGALSWENVSQWEVGKTLTIGYSRKSGAVLSDSESGPQDNASAQRHCLDQAYERWNIEVDRAFAGMLVDLNEPQLKSLRAAQQQWAQFRDAQVAAIDAYYQREGTIWVIVAGKHRVEVVRQQAERYWKMRAW